MLIKKLTRKPLADKKNQHVKHPRVEAQDKPKTDQNDNKPSQRDRCQFSKKGHTSNFPILLFYNIGVMHNIKVRKKTTNQTNSFALKLKTETNQNNTTTTNIILQNTQTTCPIKQCKLAYPSDTSHNSSFFREKTNT